MGLLENRNEHPGKHQDMVVFDNKKMEVQEQRKEAAGL
jgi:hypothetical protein